MIKKIIKTKKTNKKSTELKNKKVINSKSSPPSKTMVVKVPTTPEKQPTQTTSNNNKGNLLKTFQYLTIVLYFILHVNVIYYQNQIPWLTTGINNLIDIIKSTLGGK
ncbi:hypothetical protein HPP_5080 [Hydrangea phyllody phytoplasma]|uniref:Uncharacterized protein n=2 Tax=16SrI (Aster yellows group) TaxID=3042590 RepID=A0ABQ5PS22_9MOLU|nr:hypothetical protein [Hydrangea phyllody phytoplasma]GFZ75550.1 hypothetical protein HPP_5080 [Hydrangea phyllody phytoplasma]GLH61237.1 hypothetical protein RHYP_1820 [Rhus yellows phytoplasma]GLH62012.1 hypothetical protein HP2P_4190 [Hydrangea phyllody phytoplasma]GLH62152.1 hypothetical protein HP2P_5590 [Hydrangea phyllody phytoplasma]